MKNRCILVCSKDGRAGRTWDLPSPAATARPRIWLSPSLADRKTLHDHLGLYTNSVYATNDAPGATPATTANAVQGGIRYDHDFTPRIFAYVGADFQTDALQTLDLRSVFGGGLGVHAIQERSHYPGSAGRHQLHP